MKKPTIYEIKQNVKNAPYFFSRNNMKSAGQTLKSFRVYKTNNPVVFEIVADYCYGGKTVVNGTRRLYNAETCMFVRETDDDII